MGSSRANSSDKTLRIAFFRLPKRGQSERKATKWKKKVQTRVFLETIYHRLRLAAPTQVSRRRRHQAADPTPTSGLLYFGQCSSLSEFSLSLWLKVCKEPAGSGKFACLRECVGPFQEKQWTDDELVEINYARKAVDWLS